MGDDVAKEQPRATHVPIVHLYANRPPEAIERVCYAIEAVLTSQLSLGERDVFITVQPVFDRPGRLATPLAHAGLRMTSEVRAVDAGLAGRLEGALRQ